MIGRIVNRAYPRRGGELQVHPPGQKLVCGCCHAEPIPEDLRDQPDLPGIEELVEIARDAVIVSTADAFHHGIGYGDPPEASYPPLQGGLELARRRIEEGMEILGRGDYWGYNQHCVSAKSDARDAGQVFRYLRGPMRGRIVDLTYSDAAELYQTPAPTWVACALMAWEPV